MRRSRISPILQASSTLMLPNKPSRKAKTSIHFAADMERDHKAVNEKALALVKTGVTPEIMTPAKH